MKLPRSAFLAAALATATLAFSVALARPDPAPAAQSTELPGSEKGARAAHPQRTGANPLVYLSGELSDETVAALTKAAPGVKVIPGLTRQTALEHASEAHAIDAHLLTPEFLEKAPKLVWVQSRSAGVDRYITLKGLIENDKIVFTNARGVHGPAIAEHAIAMLLMLNHNLRAYEAAQREGQWNPDAAARPATLLPGKTMLVVGLGGIGTEVAGRAHGLGMRVIGTRRTSDSKNPDWMARVGTPDKLMEMLPEADVVALCVPLTSETEGLINEAAFKAMKPGAILINVGRGRLVDTAAMIHALDSGRLGGACLDVTDPEPLPAGHPLWKEKNVLITPHVSADGELTDERARALLIENLRRFDKDEPLLNVVDKKAGY